MKSNAGERGFTLVEVLVAFAILTVSLAALMTAFGTSAKLAARSQDKSLALMHAESVIDGLKIDLTDDTVEQTGAFDDGYRWRAGIVPYGSEDDRKAWIAAAYDVTVDVWHGRDEQGKVELRTLRLVPKGFR